MAHDDAVTKPDDGMRDYWLGRDDRPPFCRPGSGCRYCVRPTCEWEKRHA